MAIKLVPKDFVYHTNRGDAYMLGQTDQADADYEKAKELK